MSDKQLASPADVGTSREDGDVGRDLAIPAIGKAPWGTHFCQFFGTKQDLLDTLVPYFRVGLEDNEWCCWITSEPLTVDEAVRRLGREVGDFERRVAQGQMAIVPYDGLVRELTGIDPERYFTLLPLASGRDGARIRRSACYRQRVLAGHGGTGSRSWSTSRPWSRGSSNQRTIVLCTYPLVMCDSLKMIDVLVRHRFALIKQEDWTLIEPSEQKKATAAVERMNQALAERTAELQAALADLRGFSRWVTHDLRAPLRSIRGFGELLAETVEPKMDDEERLLLERIQAGTDRMDMLITDILAYSTAQQNALRPWPLDLEKLTRETWETLADALNGRRVEVRILPLPHAYGDRAMLTQVLANLLGNAIKFTGNKTDAHVEVGAETINGECAYYVRDNGEGFDMAQADKIFGAFQRLSGTIEFEGTGLGLTIVKQIITRHGGRVWAEGTPGAGSSFYFTLPTPADS